MRKILLAAVMLLTAYTFAQDVVNWRGAKNDGFYNETGLLKAWPEDGPNLLWHFDDLGPGHGSATVTKDKVFTSGTTDVNGYVIAFDHSGKELWRTEYGKEWMENWDGVRSTPTYDEGKLYIVSSYGLISCFDADNGKILWQVDALTKYEGRNIQWGITENMIIKDEKLFCTLGGEKHNVLALNKNTGDLIWSSTGKGEKSAYCSPTIIKHAGKEVLVTVTEFSIMGLDITDGTLLWSYEQKNKWNVHANTPIYKDGFLFHSCGYGKGCVKLKIAEDGTSVSEEWSNTVFDGKMGGFILLGDRVYGSGDASRAWHCMDWNTGEIVSSTKEIKKGNIIYADGLLYLYGQGGKIALAEPKPDGYNFINTFKVPYGSKQHWAHLVIHNKRLYVRHGESLMVYDIAAN
jgi:outer membrane protein assembly factor BamB